MNEANSKEAATSASQPDLAKVRLEHSLAVKRLVVDRIYIGLLVGLVLFAAGLITERFKATLIASQFLMEQRYAVATDFRKSLTAVSQNALRFTEFGCELDPTKRGMNRGPLLNATSTAQNYIDSSSLPFNRGYLDRVERVLNIFKGAAEQESELVCENRFFFIELTNYLTHITLEEVLLQSTSTWVGFRPEPVTIEALERTGSSEYYKQNFERWVAQRASRTATSGQGAK